MSEWYWLVDGKVVPAPEGKYLQQMEDRQIARTELAENISVSTVFLGLDHGFGPGHRPVLFETLVFGGDNDGDGERYYTLDEAKAGHEKYVDRCRLHLASTKSLSVSFPVLAGLAIRGEVKRAIMGYCTAHSITVDVEEEKGLLESLYTFRATGKPAELQKFRGWLEETMKQYE